MSKYKVDTSEGLHEPGSNSCVLKNRLGIIDPAEMDEVESALLLKLYEKRFLDTPPPEVLKFVDILDWHRQWLGNIYDWAGKLRIANIGKGGFQFAAADQLEKLIDSFEYEYLSIFQAINALEREELVQYLSKSHVEFILIHPFREGNGRIARLLIDTMSVKAGTGLLDYSLWDKNREFYFRAIQAGIMEDYQYIERLVRDILPA